MEPENQFRLISHHPQRANDKLEFQAYAETIREILEDLKAENSGLTIGIFGDWGSGKSTLLRMIETALKSLQTRSGQQPKSIIVHFNAWHYGQDQIWVALLREICHAVNQALRDTVWPLLITRLRLWWTRPNWSKVVFWFFGWVGRILLIFLLLTFILFVVRKGLVFLAVEGLLPDWLPSVPVIVSSLPQTQYSWFQSFLPIVLSFTPQAQLNWFHSLLTDLQAILKISGTSTVILASLWYLLKGIWIGVRQMWRVQFNIPPDLLHPKLDKDIPFVVDMFRRDFQHLVEVVGKKWPIIVLIDDLDRAPIDQITPVLEAIKHFGQETTAPAPHAPIAFVIAVDPKMIHRAIASHYKDFWSTLDKTEVENFAREYLEKIVQIPFELPPLSPSRLGPLLEDSPVPPPFLPDIVWLTMVEARQSAKEVFTYVPKYNPRLTIQAHNSFQSTWRIVQRRNLIQNVLSWKSATRLQELQKRQEQIARLLAVIILIRYNWPGVFVQIYHYPELLFDLYALATKRFNSHCTQTEIEELVSLGCPTEAPLAMVDRIRHEYPDLLHLLGKLERFHILAGLQSSDVMTYLTLTHLPNPDVYPYQIESTIALMSGDPSLVKFLKNTQADELREGRLIWLMEFVDLEQLDKKQLKAAPEEEQKLILKQAEKALFALGRLGLEQAIDWIEPIVTDHARYSDLLVTRAVFALGHLRSNGIEPVRIHQTLVNVLKQWENLPPTLTLRILRVLGDTKPSDISDQTVLVEIATQDRRKILRNEAYKRIRKDMWPEGALQKVVTDSSDISPGMDTLLELLKEINNKTKSVPQFVEDFLVTLAAKQDSQWPTQALDMLASLYPSEKALNRLSRVFMKTNEVEIRKEVLQKMGEQQNASISNDEAWRDVSQFMGNDTSPDLWVAYLSALRSSTEAEDYIRKGLSHPDTRVQKHSRTILEEMGFLPEEDQTK